jgi:eight-cysteine-cluster-containing protein
MNKYIAVLVGALLSGCGVESSAVIEGETDVLAGPEADASEASQALTATNFFPLRAGNTWTLSDGSTTKTVRVVRSSGSVHLVEGLSSSPAWFAFAGTRLWVWNTTERAWQTFVNFGSATETRFSFGGPCETFTVTQAGNKLALLTPVGSFSPAVRYTFTLSPPPHVRCAMPQLSALTFTENAGLLELRNPNQQTWSLATATVNGRSYPAPTAKATLTMNQARYQLTADGSATLRATFVVKNETSRPMTFNFSSSQQFELQVETSSGQSSYFWSADKSFLAALSSFTLQPSQSRTFSETFTLSRASAGWHTVTAWLPTRSGSRPEASTKVEFLAAPQAGCFVGGCSSQVCSDRNDFPVTTCEWREQFACYRTATCERQSNGQCGWTMTSALQQCLAR